jgi:hypothetical protein
MTRAPSASRRPRSMAMAFSALPAVLFALLPAGSVQAQNPRLLGSGLIPEEPLCRLELALDLSLGALEQPEEQVFGVIISYAFARDGTLFILDSNARRVVVFGSEGEFIRYIGREGHGPGEFQGPTRLGVGANRLIVYDQHLGRVTHFTMDGQHVESAIVPFRIMAPPSLAVLPNGGFVLTGATGSSGPVIHLFSPDLRHVRSWGSGPDWLDEVSYPLLATGSVDIDSAGRIWFAPIADYQVLRYRQDGTLEQRITRDHPFAFNPRPYTSMEDIGEGRSRFSVDRNRAFLTRVQLDRFGRTWIFVRDVPANQMVVDVFAIDGRFLQSHTFPLDTTHVSSRDSRGNFYRLTSEDGVPRIQRFHGTVRPANSHQEVSCSAVY